MNIRLKEARAFKEGNSYQIRSRSIPFSFAQLKCLCISVYGLKVQRKSGNGERTGNRARFRSIQVPLFEVCRAGSLSN